MEDNISVPENQPPPTAAPSQNVPVPENAPVQESAPVQENNQVQVSTLSAENVTSQPSIPPQTVTQAPSPTGGKKSFFKTVMLLFVSLGLLMVAAYLVIKYTQTKKGEPSEATTELSVTPTLVPTEEPTPTIELSAVQEVKLEDYQDRQLLAENDNYSAYLVNVVTQETTERSGDLVIYDKQEEKAFKAKGQFSFFGDTQLTTDASGNYLYLSSGTDVSSGITLISLAEKNRVALRFCSYGQISFWNDYLVHQNCDTFSNRPWGAGEAPSIEAINLKTGQKKILFQADLLSHYRITEIKDNTLTYEKVFVDKEADWQNTELQKTESATFDMQTLVE